ncbi:ComF family protein [Synechococcus sp. HK05]|uniref:ComF family protein n=1 Tax=Synechococcus sp. HK05 TaxID=2725975 RepID=UPI001C3811E2|nr:ComF family protein [Synechococcus sp. HK05]MBV2352742.1 ComF family protein [Synechococcus sp. HK05]
MGFHFWQHALDLISTAPCRSCGGACEPASPSPLCGRCLDALALPEGGLQGDQPLLWCALAPYAAELRGLLLRQRPKPDRAVVSLLAARLHHCCASVLPGAWLVPLPSWKRSGNPLPALVALALAEASGGRAALAPAQLLWRSRPTLGQHHLGRSLRARNLRDAFGAAPAGAGLNRPLWLVDDILTTGATACSAAHALQAAGHAVQGLLALARTPASAPR